MTETGASIFAPVLFAFFNLPEKVLTEFAENAKSDRMTHSFHRVKEERQVMMRNQNRRQHFAGLIQMSEIRF